MAYPDPTTTMLASIEAFAVYGDETPGTWQITAICQNGSGFVFARGFESQEAASWACQQLYDGLSQIYRITPPEAATVLQRQPWFLPRMTEDNWSFGFLLANGDCIRITTILAVKLWHGQLWLDVELEEGRSDYSSKDIAAPTSRLTASVNAAHIVMAFETADT